MPYVGEHAARINPPGKYAKLRRQNNKFGKGIHVIFGVLKEGGSEVQSIHFDASLFSEEEAKKWLKDNDYKVIEFAPAIEPEEAEEDKEAEGGGTSTSRYLSIEMMPTSAIQDVDGGLLVPGVKLLAPGTWTDSTQKTPCRYTPDVLQRFHTNWRDFSYWSRHAGGTPRDITDRLADIRNVHYSDGIMGDLFFHGVTSKSKDAISLIKAAAEGRVPWPYSSVEMMTRDKWLISEKLFEAQEIAFTGAAMVNEGACKVCRIRNNEEGKPSEETPSDDDNGHDLGNPAGDASQCKLTKEREMAEEEAMKKDLEDLKKELETLKSAEPPKVEIPKELMDLPGAIKELSERLEKLEKQPQEPKTKPKEEVAKSLEAPKTRVIVDKMTGQVYGA